MQRVALLIALILTTLSLFAATELRRYELPKACIEYKMTGMQSGTETLYFTNYGHYEGKYTKAEIKVGPISQKNESATYVEGDVVYTVNLGTKTGTRMVNPILKKMKDNDEDAVEAGKQMLEAMGGKEVGQGEVLGKPCTIYEVASVKTRTWVWKGIALKTEMTMPGMSQTIEAVKISDDFDESKVKRPTDIKYRDMGEMPGVKQYQGIK